MIDELNRGEDKNSNTDKEDSDKICSEDDFGSLYVTDEVFLMLIERFIERI